MKPAPLEITHREVRPGVAVVTLAGKFMLGAEGAAIDELVAQLVQTHRNIIVDLSGVTHIDSTGIGRLIASFGKVTEAGGRLLLAGATGMVREGFRVMRLDKVLAIYPDLDAALASV